MENAPKEEIIQAKYEEIQEKIREAGSLLLEIKCLARLAALASSSCIDDKELQIQDDIDYYFALKRITNLIIQVENILQ